MRGLGAITLLLAAASCGTDVDVADPPGTPPGPPSNNPIDVAIWPRLVMTGLTELPSAGPDELCRRMSIDLIGVAPDAGACEGKTVEQIARDLIAHPRFIEIERRFWVRRIGADPTAMMGGHIADADRIFEAAATGAIGYDDLVAQLLAHPIVTINRPIADGDNVTATVDKIFRLFLGRAPSTDEAADYANLLRPWRRRFEDRYDQGYSYYINPAAIDPDACKDEVLGPIACTSIVLGAPTTMNPIVMPLVPAGYSQTSARLFYYEMVQGDVPAALQAELEKPGRLLATRAELWDEAADFALARFLGWWRSTPNEPETVLPEVRRALADHFRAKPVRDLRELYVVVLTSLLYTTSAEIAVADDRPPWATGPTKLLEPEQLLDSAAHALGRELGFCDPHTNEPVGLNFYWPDRMRRPQPTDFYGFNYDFYRTTAQALGGCLGAVGAPRQPGLPAMLTHIEIAERLCTAPSQILPAGIDPGDTTPAAMTATAERLFTRLLARPPAADERAALDAAVQACITDPACGDAGGLARETCGALLRSAAFLYD